jgi:transcriptional regulator with XRE-family HTH domain
MVYRDGGLVRPVPSDGSGDTRAEGYRVAIEQSDGRVELGRYLEQLRKAAGLTQQELAGVVFKSRSSIANIETGRQNSDRAFWVRADEATGADGALVAAYERTRMRRAQIGTHAGTPDWSPYQDIVHRLGHPGLQGDDPAAALLDKVDSVRRELDRTLATSSGVAASQIAGSEEVASASARECATAPPFEAIDQLLIDIAEVSSLIPVAQRLPLQVGILAVVAKLAALVADELMVVGQTRQSRSWHATARFAADQAGDRVLWSHPRGAGGTPPCVLWQPGRCRPVG